MDTIFFKKTIVKKLFHFFCAVALFLIGSAVFAQEAFTTVYDNGGKPIKGSFMTIGNKSDAPYNLNIPSKDPNCPVNIKWARLYWAGHAGGGNKDQVRLVGPGGLNKSITKDGGNEETNGVVWADADYLIYRFYFTSNDGADLDIAAEITSPVRYRAGYCRGRFSSQDMPIRGAVPSGNFAMWSGDNTGVGLESIIINVKKIKQAHPASQDIVMNFYAGWFRRYVSGNMAIKAEAYRGEMINDPADYYNWIPAPGAQKVGEATFPIQLAKYNGACNGNKWTNVPTGDMYHFGEFVYNPSDGRILWKKSSTIGGGQEYLGQSNVVDPTKTIVNDGTRVDDDSYYYRWYFLEI